MLLFPPFRLDTSDERLWRGNDPIALKPKAFAVLRYLAERPRRLITKQELLNHFWGDVFVGDAVLKTHMAEIRRALGDDIKSPRFIETAHRRGYRFIAEVKVAAPSPALDSARHSPSCVGRERELQQLEASLGRALQGRLQAVFLTGAAGAGKTSLANEFFARLEARGDLWLARGQCVESFAAGEAYLPVLEALGRLCREPGKERILELLRKYAPSWLVQVPGVLDAAERAALAASAAATPACTLHQIADAMLSISEERGLVLLLEDLHRADAATLRLISYLARRSDPARVLLIGTYRPGEASEHGHPLVSVQLDLQVSGRAEEITLTQPGADALSDYLDARFPGHRFPPQVLEALRERSGDSPLILISFMDYWLRQRWLVQNGSASSAPARRYLRAGARPLQRSRRGRVERAA